MMYNQKLVASIKANGKILREFKDQVYVPFSSEYSVLLKNINTVRAVVNVFIDGTNVVPGGLVLDAGREIELERSIKNNNLNEGNKFKFIERSDAVEQHRGVKLEDGIVRIEYQFEHVYTPTFLFNNQDRHVFGSPRPPYGVPRLDDIYCKGIAQNATNSVFTASSVTLNAVNTSASVARSYVSDVGITVPGSKSDQKFTTVSAFPLQPEKYSIILHLLGETEDNKPVRVPVSVKHKQKCETCGTLNKATSKFCHKCGTALTVYA